ncbi:MAG: protein kinase, partial [Gemmataceae bacterium]|nr:protein kinase [Gemmataceae bacterium]
PAPPPPPAADAGLLCLDLDQAGPEAAAALAPPPPPAPPAPRRFKVVDGGDQGRSFRLPDVGTVTLGKRGHATIGLNDLYVTRVHCSLEVDPHSILVTHVEGQNGTLIDSQRIAGPTRLRPGNVLRIGNSHLKLEVGPFGDEATAADPWLGEERPRVRMPHGPSAEVPAGGKSGVFRGPESGGKPSKTDDGEVTRAEPQEPGATDFALVEDDPLDGLTGQTLGHYEVGEMLGRGPSGAVYRAADQKTGQAVALKVFPAGFPASAAELERMVREFKAAQQLRHPNLVAPLGAGKSGPHFWISRELVEGESAAGLIAAIADGEKPSWTRAARVAVHLARLLDWLHRQGVVHGNITPGNVLLRGADRTTKLADLRLAQALEGSRLQQSVRGKKLLADLPYLAPEQAEPGASADDLADLYAVGAVVYALITGRPPAAGDTPKEVRKGRPPRPSSVYNKVPPEFDGTVMRLLARYREDRFPTAAALLADLELLAQSHDLKL